MDADTAADYCRQGCEHDVECGTATDVELCTSDCVGDVTGVVREDAFIDITNCFTGLECGTNDDACFAECTPTSTHEDYETRCRETLGACDLSAAEIDGICEVTPNPAAETGFLCVITPSILEEVDACFDEPDCTAQLTCMQTVFESNGVDF